MKTKSMKKSVASTQCAYRAVVFSVVVIIDAFERGPGGASVTMATPMDLDGCVCHADLSQHALVVVGLPGRVGNLQ